MRPEERKRTDSGQRTKAEIQGTRGETNILSMWSGKNFYKSNTNFNKEKTVPENYR